MKVSGKHGSFFYTHMPGVTGIWCIFITTKHNTMKRKLLFTALGALMLCLIAPLNMTTARYNPTAYVTSSSKNCDESHTYNALLSGASAVSYSWSLSGDGAFLSPTNGGSVLVIPDQGFDVGTSYTVCVDILATNGQTYSDCYVRTVPSYLACGGRP